MSYAWEAEHSLTPDEAMVMIKSQFPDLEAQSIQLLGMGWDNTAFLVNQDYVFRFPRRQVAVSLLEIEFCVLPKIAPHLPLSIPIPQWKGSPTNSYPWPFTGYRKLAGITACHADLSDADRMKLAQPLAHFLALLHAIPLSKVQSCQLPGDLLDRLKVARLIPEIKKNLKTLASLQLLHSIQQYDSLLENTQDVDLQEQRVLVHGDFYIRHVLVNSSHELAGVIDWGDVHLGNRAVDLSIAHSFLPMQAHDSFRHIYGTISEATWQLARLRALYHSSILGVYGYHSKDSTLLREGLGSLKRIALESS